MSFVSTGIENKEEFAKKRISNSHFTVQLQGFVLS